MTLIGLMAAFITPRFGSNRDRLLIKTTVKDVASVFRFARNQAVILGRDVSVVYDFGKNQISVLPRIIGEIEADKNENGDGEFATAIRLYTLPEDVSPDFSDKGSDSDEQQTVLVAFYALGNSSGGQVVISDKRDHRVAINIDSITGTVNVLE